MGDLSPSRPVRIEAPATGEERNARDSLAQKPFKPVAAKRKDPQPPEVDLEPDEDSNKKHQLDERA